MQYLTCAQGMPTNVESTLTKHIHKFVWDGASKPNASMNLLCTPTNKGGKSLLHLKYRNEGIELVWLKKLLEPHSKHPPWATFAHALVSYFSSNVPTAKDNA
ncbi:hypothetical protein J3A83DRAFT_4112633 [Scleroderma citrinum]